MKDVTKIDCIKYIEVDSKLKYDIWQYYVIGDSKQYNVGCEPVSLKAYVGVLFHEEHLFWERWARKQRMA